jgi:hypothetical protein
VTGEHQVRCGAHTTPSALGCPFTRPLRLPSRKPHTTVARSARWRWRPRRCSIRWRPKGAGRCLAGSKNRRRRTGAARATPTPPGTNTYTSTRRPARQHRAQAPKERALPTPPLTKDCMKGACVSMGVRKRGLGAGGWHFWGGRSAEHSRRKCQHIRCFGSMERIGL